jgi:hypothetical protein
MFQREDDVIPDSPRAERKGMSLNDKMSMWDSKAGEDRSVIETDDLYQGVKDDEDEITDRVDLPVYHKIILDSAAYEWFLASLRKEITLQWSATQPRVMVESIRQRILDQLPTGMISKRRALGGHEVKFDLQWGDTFKGWLEHENFDQLIRSIVRRTHYRDWLCRGSPGTDNQAVSKSNVACERTTTSRCTPEHD